MMFPIKKISSNNNYSFQVIGFEKLLKNFIRNQELTHPTAQSFLDHYSDSIKKIGNLLELEGFFWP